jgi:hypothetical protein
MKLTTVKALAAKLSIPTFAAGTLMFAGMAPAQAQQWGVAVQYGQPAYVVERNDYVGDRERHEYWERESARREFYERQRREEFLRRQAYLRHEQWEREHRYHDRDREYYGYR